jgi:signal transduction histidine kinase
MFIIIRTRRHYDAGVIARVWLFALATVAVALLIGLATFNVWKHLATLGSNIKTQEQSLDIAEEFQLIFHTLNNRLLQFEITSNPANWNRFEQEWGRLNAWIDDQKATLKTANEIQVLKEIDDAFDKYHEAAKRLSTSPKTNQTTHLVEFGDFQRESEGLMQLGSRLARAHEETQQDLYAATNLSLAHLRTLLIIAFILLLLLSAGLWGVVYRDMIVPLQAKLIESRALLERQEKLASLGVLSAGLAHEIRNPLTAMKARLFTLRKRLEPASSQEQDAAVISREVDRLDRILKDFLEFARPSEPTLTRARAYEFLEEVRALLLPQLEQQNIQLLLEGNGHAVINIDQQQMTQVMLNLVRNAAESIGRNGTVSLRVREESVLLNGRASDVAVLEVSDTGKGIAPDVEKRLFDPFHTTKDGGTGLGLSIAGRIVERHGGALRYKTRLGQGTTFGVVLPRSSNE